MDRQPDVLYRLEDRPPVGEACLAVSLAMGLGVTFVPEVLDHLPALMKNMFSSGIATGGIVAIALNILLPDRG